MKKSIGAVLIGVGLLMAALPVSAASLTSAQIDAIINLLQVFGADSKVISDVKTTLNGGSTTGSSKSSSSSSNTSSGSSYKQNLTISSIQLKYPALGGNSMGNAQPDQTLTVVVKNDQYGTPSLSYKKFKYAVYLYEMVDGEKEGKTKVATGEAYVPYANGYSEFQVNFEGGFPFDGDFERDYIAEVRIDTEKKIPESNENDNTGWSDVWMTDYYKG